MSAENSASDFNGARQDELVIIKSLRENATHENLIGLAFSGGGIRSATFNLGVLQALAKRKLLGSFDYLSTVSGGGYIGAWFTALIRRAGAGNCGLRQIQEKLTQPKEAPEIGFLRRYSNYLTPKTGLFSTDTLAAFSIWITNTLLNQLILLAGFITLFILLRIVNQFASVNTALHYNVLLWVGSLLLPFGFAAAWAITLYKKRKPDKNTGKLSLWNFALGWLGTALLAMGLLGRHSTMLLSYLKQYSVLSTLNTEALHWLALGLGTTVLSLLLSLIVIVLIGIGGRSIGTGTREWWGRLGGVNLLVSLIWLGMFTAAIYLPPIIDYWIKPLNFSWALVWSAASWGVAQLGKSPQTGGKRSGRWLELLVKTLPYLVIVSAVVLVGYAARELLAWINDISAPEISTKNAFFMSSVWGNEKLLNASFLTEWLTLLIAIVVAGVFSWRVDINLFSLHHFYRNRLTRCYLGATRPEERHPNAFTGFDPKDDLNLAECINQRPYPIINATLNLTSGQELAWQQRMAAAFVFTPLWSGYELASDAKNNKQAQCFRKTAEFCQDGIMIGSAMAVSGAAASPNMGYHTNHAMAFLMTIFNARLGRWYGNPAYPQVYKNQAPPFSLPYLLNEIVAKTTNQSNYIYLSDGGHFENLGIYELVRRRCRLIVAIDVGADGGYTFDDLGNAIRKCQTDFGIRIDMELDDVRPCDDKTPSRQHHLIGHIAYGERYGDGQPDGVLLYIKSSLTGKEPADLQNFKAQQKDFPHHTTADQFFDESQFESYRHLGVHAMEKTLKTVLDQADGSSHTWEQFINETLSSRHQVQKNKSLNLCSFFNHKEK